MRERLARAFLWIAKWLHTEEEPEEEELHKCPFNEYNLTSPTIGELPVSPEPIESIYELFGQYL